MSTILGHADPLTELRPTERGAANTATLAALDAELDAAWSAIAADADECPLAVHAFPSFEELTERAAGCARRFTLRIVRVPAVRAPAPHELPALATVWDFPMVLVNAPIYLTGLIRIRRAWDETLDWAARLMSLTWAKVHRLMAITIALTAAQGALHVVETATQAVKDGHQVVADHASGVWDDFAQAFGSPPTANDLATARRKYLRDGTLIQTPRGA